MSEIREDEYLDPADGLIVTADTDFLAHQKLVFAGHSIA